MKRRILRSWGSSSHIGGIFFPYRSGFHVNSIWNPRALDRQKRGWIDIEPNPMIHGIDDSLRIGYKHKADNQARIVWYPMSIDQKLSSSVLIYIWQ